MQLYQKQKTVNIEQEDLIIKITINFKDHFHDMKSTVTINSDSLVILSAKVEMQAVPWDLCYEVLTKMDGLVGLKIQKGIKDQVKKILGGAQGCVHLLELTMDSITAMVQLIDYFRMPKEMPYKDKMKQIKEINQGICHTYNTLDRNPKLLKENVQSQID